MCGHLSCGPEPWLNYVKWYLGRQLANELLCVACANTRQGDEVVPVSWVCESCFVDIFEERAQLVGVRGQVGVDERVEPFSTSLQRTALPAEVGRVVDLAPVVGTTSSHWVLLTEAGELVRFNADSLEWSRVARCSVSNEDEGIRSHRLRRRLHVSADGNFAAVVNDFGYQGQVIDLRSGEVTMALHSEGGYAGEVPFSLAFAVGPDGQTVVIHRTDSNRLDVSNPANGRLLTVRESPAHLAEHYLDYFYGAIAVSPGQKRILADGWLWHPIGIPMAWSLEEWLVSNVWESEDGPSKRDLCYRESFWNGAMTWIDDTRCAIGGIGPDRDAMVDGARIFDVPGSPERAPWNDEWRERQTVFAFGGPAGRFFSDGRWLFSADSSGLSRWDVSTGERTGHLSDFQPTHHHRGSGELVQLEEGVMIRLLITSSPSSSSDGTDK